MDAEHFDRITRILAVAPSRRGLLGLAVGSLVGALGWEAADAKKKGKSKKKKCGACGPCRSCVKGTCKPKPNGTACGGECEECRDGACVAKDDGTDCGNGDICQSGVCGCEPGFEPCGGDCVQSCATGQELSTNCQCVCTTQSCAGCCDGETCLPVGASQSPEKCGSGGAACGECGPNEQCTQGACGCLAGFERCDGNCVQSCDGDFVLNDECQCACPPNREACGDVCCAGRKICVDPDNGACVTGQGTCKTGDNVCPFVFDPDPELLCNGQPDCFCAQTTRGDTRCAQSTGHQLSGCGGCSVDADCVSVGTGAFCVDGSQTQDFCCAAEVRGYCALPCDTDPPGACPAGTDGCANGGVFVNCNGRADCFCIKVDGETRCLRSTPGSTCDQCDEEAGCEGAGEGAFCFIDEGPNCTCGIPGRGFCVVDCPPLDFLSSRAAMDGETRRKPGRQGIRPPARRETATKRKRRRRRERR